MCNFVTVSFNIFQNKATFQNYYYLIMCILNLIDLSLEMCGSVLDFMYNPLLSTYILFKQLMSCIFGRRH